MREHKGISIGNQVRWHRRRFSLSLICFTDRISFFMQWHGSLEFQHDLAPMRIQNHINIGWTEKPISIHVRFCISFLISCYTEELDTILSWSVCFLPLLSQDSEENYHQHAEPRKADPMYLPYEISFDIRRPIRFFLKKWWYCRILLLTSTLLQPEQLQNTL